MAEGDGEIYTQTLAELYAKQGAVDKAVEVYRKLLEDDPDNGMFLHRVAELSKSVGVDPATTDDRPVVPVESLVPDPEPVVPVESLTPDPEPVVPVESLAPAPEPVVVDHRPVVPIESLAPSHIDDRQVVPIESLAPDGSSDGQDDDPFPWMNKL